MDFDPTTKEGLDELAQWVWNNRTNPGNPCNNYARHGRYVAVEFDGGGTASVHHFDTDDTAATFISLVRSDDQLDRLEAWDMAGHYDYWDAGEVQ